MYEPVKLAFKCVEPDGCLKDKAPILFLHGLSVSKEQWGDIPEIVAEATKRKDFVNVDQNAVVCDESTDADIISQLLVNNQAEDRLSWGEEGKEIQEKPQPSALEASIHMNFDAFLKVYALDSRNHGDSPWSDVLNFDSNEDDLLCFMDHISAPKAIIVGHNIGAITGMKVALRAPERVEKLVVEDTNCKKFSQPMMKTALHYLYVMQTAIEKVPVDADEDTARQRIFDSVYRTFEILVKPDEANFLLQLKKESPDGRWTFKSNITSLTKALKNPQNHMSEPTGVFEGPTCFIYIKRSARQEEQDIKHNRKFFPNAKMVGIGNVDHSLHSERPREFTDALLNFIQE